ncbi:hypothetical protein [Rhodoligotrophos defluvii]|uniref:hypothetical protein n=1 Tax=Rhodoligotrophos defluvii TaxID=2561934 RepID=UPI0010C93923|nr:hypothetical protein [Rhodoligotrophos defluvii]
MTAPNARNVLLTPNKPEIVKFDATREPSVPVTYHGFDPSEDVIGLVVKAGTATPEDGSRWPVADSPDQPRIYLTWERSEGEAGLEFTVMHYDGDAPHVLGTLSLAPTYWPDDDHTEGQMRSKATTSFHYKTEILQEPVFSFMDMA